MPGYVDLTIYPIYSMWFKIDLGTSRLVVTVFIVNVVPYDHDIIRMGNSFVCVGENSAGPKAAGNTCTNSPIHDGGFITVRLRGRYVFVFREGGAVG